LAVFELMGGAFGWAASTVDWGRIGYFPALATAACGQRSGACFNVRLEMFFAVTLTVLGSSLAMLADEGDGRSRRSHRAAKLNADARSMTLELVPENATSVEVALTDPGARAVLLASGLAWSGWWCLEGTLEGFTTGELLGVTWGRSVVRSARQLRMLVGLVVAFSLPTLVRSVGEFGAWLSASLALASLLLVGVGLRADPGFASVEVWLSAFGGVEVFLLVVPYVIMIRRAQARGTPAALAVAMVNVPAAAACLGHAALAGRVRNLLGETGTTDLCVGAVCALWAAEVCSRAIVCDRDGFRLPPPATAGPAAGGAALSLPIPARRGKPRP